MLAREQSFGAARAVPVVRAARAGGRFPLGAVLLPALAVALVVAAGLRNSGREAEADVSAAVRVGDRKPMGKGEARAWVRYDDRRVPTAVGVTLTESALAGLPDADAGVAACCDVTEHLLKLPRPEGVLATPFDHVAVRWNPRGLGLKGTAEKPVLDFQFHLTTPQHRGGISAEGDDLARARKPLAKRAVPAGYVLADGALPASGARWIDPASLGAHGRPFTRTLVYGSYDGRLTFIAPVITRSFLEVRPDIFDPIAVPQSYPTPGLYPSACRVTYDPAKREYTVALEGLTRG